LTQNILSVSVFDPRILSEKEKLSVFVSAVSVHIRCVFIPTPSCFGEFGFPPCCPKLGIQGPSSPKPVRFPSLGCFPGYFRVASRRHSTSMTPPREEGREGGLAAELVVLLPWTAMAAPEASAAAQCHGCGWIWPQPCETRPTHRLHRAASHRVSTKPKEPPLLRARSRRRDWRRGAEAADAPAQDPPLCKSSAPPATLVAH
jgi:hypothetical protein